MENFKIDSKNINLKAIEICSKLQTYGYQAFIVGGCVRDLLLNNKPKDWDICSNASPEKIMEIFPKNIPTGLQHGTITVVMGEGIGNHFEVTTFRIESQYLDGRRPESVEFIQNIKEDLSRRDLTINAIAFDPISQTLVDPFDGIQDLKYKIIKAVGKADDRFREDGLRIMRAARFASRFGYEIEEHTFTGMISNLETLKLVSKERIKDELCKMLITKYAFYGLNILREAKILNFICPLLKLDGEDEQFSVEINKCDGELETKVALLYHSVSDWNDVESELNNLKFSNKEIKRIIFQLRALHMARNEFDRSLYVHFMAWLKNNSPDPWEHTLSQFIRLTRALNMNFEEVLIAHQFVVVLSRKELQINGNDLIELGVKAGPAIKSILDKCYSEVLSNPINNNKDYLSIFILTQS